MSIFNDNEEFNLAPGGDDNTKRRSNPNERPSNANSSMPRQVQQSPRVPSLPPRRAQGVPSQPSQRQASPLPQVPQPSQRQAPDRRANAPIQPVAPSGFPRAPKPVVGRQPQASLPPVEQLPEIEPEQNQSHYDQYPEVQTEYVEHSYAQNPEYVEQSYVEQPYIEQPYVEQVHTQQHAQYDNSQHDSRSNDRSRDMPYLDRNDFDEFNVPLRNNDHRTSQSNNRSNHREDNDYGDTNYSNFDNSRDYSQSLTESASSKKPPHLRHIIETEEVPAEDTNVVKKKGKNTKSRSRKNSKSTEGEEKPVSRFTGGRKRVLIVNTVAIAVVLSFLGVGLNSIINPPRIPSPEDVKSVAAATLNKTEFNTDGGRAIVLSFAKEYFNINASGDSNTRMLAYTSEEIAAAIGGSRSTQGEGKQVATGETYITGINSIDDNNATYNVAAKINNKWVYIDIPVYFDKSTFAYSISGIPSFTPAPRIATTGLSDVQQLSPDTEAEEASRANLERFFKAWATSSETDIKGYSRIDADAFTHGGLQSTVFFKGIDEYIIEAKDANDPTFNERRATASIIFGNTEKNPTITYTQGFDLKMNFTDGRWFVADIKPQENKFLPPGVEPIVTE